MTKKSKRLRHAASSVAASTVQQPIPAMPTQGGHPNVTTVTSRQEFEREAERLRNSGYTQVPGYIGGGREEGFRPDYGAYIEAKLACEGDCGGSSKASLPLLHVTSGGAVSVKAENGHEGKYITWGAGNRLPNVISLLCELNPYTSPALKFNIDLATGMGPKPMCEYTQYVGGNLTNKRVPFDQFGTLLAGLIRDQQQQLLKLEETHPELTEQREQRESGGESGGQAPDSSLLLNQGASPINPPKQSAAAQMKADIEQQIADLRQQLLDWQRTKKELDDFLEHNNLLDTYQQLYSDMLIYNICYPEFELQQTYLVDSTERDPQTGKPRQKQVEGRNWNPKITGLKFRNAKTIRLEQLSPENKIENVYVSNQWLSSPDQTLPARDSDYKIDAIPAVTSQSPKTDLDGLVRTARKANAGRKSRPTHVVLPLRYNQYNHPYYPVPAWWSLFSGDVYLYASILISDRKKRRDNANVIGRILYLNDEYVQRMYMQRGYTEPDQKKKFFDEEIIAPINNFLTNRDNSGKPMLAYTFTGADGKEYKSWEIVEIEESSKQSAEANQKELAEISSIILFAMGVDSRLIGNSPGDVSSSGGTDLRERYLLKQVQMSTLQSIVLSALDVVKQRNGWISNLVWEIRSKTLTTLDRSKTGLVDSEDNT